jgi:hypothetical protein
MKTELRHTPATDQIEKLKEMGVTVTPVSDGTATITAPKGWREELVFGGAVRFFDASNEHIFTEAPRGGGEFGLIFIDKTARDGGRPQTDKVYSGGRQPFQKRYSW